MPETCWRMSEQIRCSASRFQRAPPKAVCKAAKVVDWHRPQANALPKKHSKQQAKSSRFSFPVLGWPQCPARKMRHAKLNSGASQSTVFRLCLLPADAPRHHSCGDLGAVELWTCPSRCLWSKGAILRGHLLLLSSMLQGFLWLGLRAP